MDEFWKSELAGYPDFIKIHESLEAENRALRSVLQRFTESMRRDIRILETALEKSK